MATIGCLAWAARTAQPGCFRMPRERNFSAICVRNASVGTTTSSFGHLAETRTDSIVSVLPVPVGITIVAMASVMESWTRGISDYTNNNGEATIYGVYVLENGDKFFTRGSLIAVQTPEASNLTATTVGPITGGTGKLSRINGMARTSTTANPTTGLNETQVDIEYWLPQ